MLELIVALKSLISGFLGIAFIASTTLVSANINNQLSDSTTIGISVVVYERAEDQQCVVGFRSETNRNLTDLQNKGCQYDSATLLRTAYQQATKRNSQGFVTVVITAP